MDTHYGQRCRAAREGLGLSLNDARDRLLFAIPRRYVPSISKLARLETGAIAEADISGIVIYGLARVYGCRVSDLSSVVAEELDAISDLLSRTLRCFAT